MIVSLLFSPLDKLKTLRECREKIKREISKWNASGSTILAGFTLKISGFRSHK